MSGSQELEVAARRLRAVHNAVGAGELACLGELWYCAIARRRGRWLGLSVGVLLTEGVALVAARGCPLGVVQRRLGDDAPMFELWFGPRLAPFAIPGFTALAVAGALTLLRRPPVPRPVGAAPPPPRRGRRSR